MPLQISFFMKWMSPLILFTKKRTWSWIRLPKNFILMASSQIKTETIRNKELSFIVLWELNFLQDIKKLVCWGHHKTFFYINVVHLFKKHNWVNLRRLTNGGFDAIHLMHLVWWKFIHSGITAPPIELFVPKLRECVPLNKYIVY